MPKIGHQYIDTPMAFSEVPSGVKFIHEYCLYQKCTWIIPDDDHSTKAVDVHTRHLVVFESTTEVVAWMPKALLAQREREKTPEWQRKHREAQERLKNRDWYEEPELVIDGEKDRELRFIPVR